MLCLAISHPEIFCQNIRVSCRYKERHFAEFQISPTERISIIKLLFKITQFIHKLLYRMLQHGIQHVLYPTFWVPSLPFYTAAQLQHGYAYANGIALLAAGCSHPMTGQGGSGIFLGKSGATALIMPSEATQ